MSYSFNNWTNDYRLGGRLVGLFGLSLAMSSTIALADTDFETSLNKNSITDERQAVSATLTEEVPSSLGSLEFRGVMRINDKWRFSMRDTATQSAFWLEMKKTINGLTPIFFDTEAGVLTLIRNNRPHRLRLAKADPSPISVVASNPDDDQSDSPVGYDIPPAPSFSPPPPPNGGHPPQLPAPKQVPTQPQWSP